MDGRNVVSFASVLIILLCRFCCWQDTMWKITHVALSRRTAWMLLSKYAYHGNTSLCTRSLLVFSPHSVIRLRVTLCLLLLLLCEHMNEHGQHLRLCVAPCVMFSLSLARLGSVCIFLTPSSQVKSESTQYTHTTFFGLLRTRFVFVSFSSYDTALGVYAWMSLAFVYVCSVTSEDGMLS